MPTLNTVIKQASRGADLYFVFRFLRLLTMKYERTDAYKYGIIDKKGKPLKKSSELETVDEKASYTMLHRLVFKVRRLIEKVPVLGKSILLNYAAALFLLKEQDNKRIWTDENYMERELNKFLESDWEEEAEQLKEAFRGQYGKTQSEEFLFEEKLEYGDTKSLKKYKKMTPGQSVNEREMTDTEKKKREEIVLSLKKKKKDFQDRYGDDWENVMYATATKMAMGEEMKKFTDFQYVKEDGHRDVESAKNQVKIAMDALQKMNTLLATLPDDGSLPTWWTNKVAIAVNNLDGMADYLDTQVEQVVVNLMQSLGKRKISESNVECVKTLKKIVEQVDKRGPCWVGYVQQGMKKKGGKLVPNCVPEEVEIGEDKKWHYYNLDRGVYRLQKDNNGKIIGKMHDRQKEMRAGFPNADEVLSTTKQAAAKVAKLNEQVEIGEAFKVGDKVKISKTASKGTKSGHKDVLGKTGKIIKDYGDGDMKVNFGGNDDRSVSAKDLVKEGVGVRKVDFVDGVTEDSPPPVNAAPTAPDSGNVQYQEPVLGKKKKKKKIDEAKIITSTFAGKQVFVVDSDMYHQCRLGKQKYHRYEKYVGNKRIGKAIREYGLKHPKRPIILQNGENGPMLYLRYGRS